MHSYQKHLVVALSSHGYGHVAMTAPLINRLQERHPELKITLRTAAPLTFISSKYHGPFEHLPQSCDIGMLMNSAFDVDRENTLQAYRHLHAEWDRRIKDEMNLLKEISADMVISNIAYLPLIAARQLGIPAIAISCLNWADIFEHFFPNEHGIRQQITTAYQSANIFIRTEPAMPMPNFTTHTVGPLATIGNSRRSEIIERLNLEPETRLVLLSMGGIKTELSAKKWPALEGVHYITANAVEMEDRSDISPCTDANISYNDALASCDLLLTKPGYGSFTEAACNNTPVLYVRRDEWPEQPYLTEWLHRHTSCAEIMLEQFENGEFAQQLKQLLQQKRGNSTIETGIEEAISIIEKHL